MAFVCRLAEISQNLLHQRFPGAVGSLVTTRCFATEFRGLQSEYKEVVDVETHTGQKWKPGDFRLARFIETPKQVTKHRAIDLISKVPPKPCQDRVVYCDGGGGPLGHPKIYINLDQPGNHTCGYCGLRFFQEGHKHY